MCIRDSHQSACQDKQRAQAALDEVYAAAETCVEQVQQNDMQAEALRGRMSGLETAAGEEDAAIAVLQTGVDHNQESMTRLEREMADSSSRTEDLQGQMDALTRRTEEIDRRTQELTGELEGWMQQLQSMTQRAGSAVREAEALRAREALATAAAADGRVQLSGLEAQSQAARTRLEEVGRELEQLQERRQTEESAAAENRKALEEAREEAAAAENVIQGHGLKMGGRQRRAQESAQQREQLSRQAAAMEDRIRLLTEMEKEYEGFSRAVKLVMQAADKGGLRGVHGPVASLMTTQEQYTVAIEIALGGALQNIVVDTQNDAKSAIGYLKQRDGGRATFLPLDAVRGEKLRESRIEEEYGFVGVASELVQYEKRYDGVFQNLLGRTVVVEDLDCGVTMARRYQNRFRIVTLDGQVINRGGSMTGGSVSRSAGVLSRANELQRLAGQLEQLRGQLADADRRAQETGRELQKAQYELDVAKEQQRAAAQQVLTLEGRQEHYEILLENLRLSQDGLQQERETLTRRLQEQETQMQAVRQEIAAHEGEAERLSRQAEESRAGQSDLQTRTDEISGQITEHKTALAALAAERGTSLHSRQELERLQAQMHTDRAGREALLERFRRSNEEAGREMDIHRQKAEELRTQCGRLKEQLASLAAEKLELERRRTQQNQEMQRCNEEVLHTEREVARLEQQKNAAAMEEKNILDKLWERYELSHSEAQSQRMELESIPKATRRIGELNREIKSLGTPNIGAIEEFDRVNTRYTYLSEQRTDVEKAKEELTGVIDEITRQMTEIFAQQFRLLNESFQETFLELFGGGKARLELEDENDILGCGIEIKVQPPGKQLKTITLLSGGEKAFVAIALYFAIMKVHPTPFCVMDEIEAALDEANVVRYARYMRRIAGKTQFIVITHRRGTMEEADVLYGVTMQERGVSRILTINLNDMAKELKIK